MPCRIRLARQDDSPDVVRVIKSVFDEYGFTWDAADYHADLYDLDGHYLSKGLPFWVAEEDGRVVGTAALGLFEPVPGEVGKVVEHEGALRIGGCDCSLERLYVEPGARKSGIGGALMQTVLEEARRRGRRRMEIWSDKRFGDAHRLYGRFGASTAGDRICHDPDQSPEFGLSIELVAG